MVGVGRMGFGAVLIVAAALVLALVLSAPASAGKGKGEPNLKKVHWDKRLQAAKRVARKRAGKVSFSVRGGGVRRSSDGRRGYKSASVVKAMMLVAYLRRYDDRELSRSERKRLKKMIRRSHDDSATEVRDIIGNGALERLADKVGMPCFASASSWGSTQICSRDMAKLFKVIDELMPRRHRRFGMTQLRRIVRKQRWGIPEVTGWKPFFKSGWYPDPGGWRVHQVALLRSPRRQELAVAVLTSGQPSKGYGIETVRKVANQLVGPVAR